MGSFRNGCWVSDGAEFRAAQHIRSLPMKETQRYDDHSAGNSCSKKRARVGFSDPSTKAGREKMRRDRLNDRFVELSSYLPNRSADTDKIFILSDATHLLNQLQNDSKNLKEKIESLRDTIKSLKADKMELREEKLQLKAEKEKIEGLMKNTGDWSAFVPNPAFIADASGKTFQYTGNYPPPMWQWVPPATMDTSRDYVLRPPVA